MSNFAVVEQLKDLVSSAELDQLKEAFAPLGPEPEVEQMYTELRHLYDAGGLSLASFLKVFNWLAVEELPVMTYHNATFDELTNTPHDEDEEDPHGQITERHVLGDHYALMGKLGEGGSGEVMIARDTHLERRVALKRLKQFASVPHAVKRRFLNEAQVTAQLDHPNIIPIYGLQAVSGASLAFTMKLVRGKSLTDLINESRDDWAAGKRLDEDHNLNARLDVFLKICDAMDFAHSKGVLHRDLKPANIMIGRFGEVYVMDWGIAKLSYGDQEGDLETVQPTVTGGNPEMTSTAAAGTPIYMSPEQARGETLDERSDQYTLGLILYELVCLQRARKADNQFAVIAQAARGDRQPIRHAVARHRIPRDLTAIIEKATAVRPEHRYENVHVFAADLRRYQRGEAVEAKPDSFTEMLGRHMGHHQQAVIMLFLLTIALSAAMVFWSFYLKADQLNKIADENAVQTRKQNRIVSAVTAKANAIDEFIRNYEQALLGMAFEAELLLEDPRDEPLFGPEAFEQNLVPFTVEAAAYSRAVNPREPVLFTSEDLGDQQPMADRPAMLKHHFRRLMRLGRRPSSAEELDAMIIAKQGAVVWAYAAFEDGSMLLFPGMGGFPEDFDPRTRPWYRLDTGRDKVHWHPIYHTMTSRQPELPCSVPLYDRDGKAVGVLGVNIDFKLIAQGLLPMDDNPWTSYLVDPDGQIIVSSENQTVAFISEDNPRAVTRSFPYPEILPLLQDDTPVKDPQQDLLFACRTLKTKDWRYIVVVNPKDLE